LAEDASAAVDTSPGAGDDDKDVGGVGRSDHPPDADAAGTVAVNFLVTSREDG
jgi:hypothetical protein